MSWGCIGLLAVLSLTPGDYYYPVRSGAPDPGDVDHFVAYLGTSIAVSIGYGRRASSLTLAALLSGYAGLLEISQNWIPERHSRVADFAESAAGVVAGVVFIWLWRRARLLQSR
jgi:VanZ family protein